MSEYEVGYGRPPRRHQFKKGASGNSKGRPKKKKAALLAMPADLTEMVLREAGRKIPIVENGKNLEISITGAILRRLGVSAAKGDNRAAVVFFRLVELAQERAKLNLEEAREIVPDLTSVTPEEATKTYLRMINGTL